MVFKKQNYQSVYEYPKETTTASPTQNADRQQGWATYLANSSPFSSSVSDSFLVGHTIDDDDDSAINTNNPIEFNALNGFGVSSSSRPFHLNQFGIECQTWPTEPEFSWSQIQVSKSSFSKKNKNQQKQKVLDSHSIIRIANRLTRRKRILIVNKRLMVNGWRTMI